MKPIGGPGPAEFPALRRLDRKDRIRFRNSEVEFEIANYASARDSEDELHLSPY